MATSFDLARRAALTPLSVLIVGETGVGKELIARAVHQHSPRANGPLVSVSCAALRDELAETELFGHQASAFTGADKAKIGLFEEAAGGTFFLDEVAELSPGIQAKLLRAIEEKTIMPVGGNERRSVDVRVVAATHRDLRQEIAAGRFRMDLYFRLSGVIVHVPPLRLRRIEIEPLARAFLGRLCSALGQREPELTAESLALLESYRWPGNVRELGNVIERAVLLSRGGAIGPEHIQFDASLGAPDTPHGSSAQPDEGERARLLTVLTSCGGNQTRAAHTLGISRSALARRLDRLGLPRPRRR
jgi:DNA-binding NtrC family response regulator